MFIATELALKFVAAIRPVIEATMPRDKDLAVQMRRASNSSALNTAEGGRRRGGDRLHSFTVASAEADEALVAARLAVAAGYAPERLLAPVRSAEDQLQAVLWRMRHPRR
jgi:four helix bundle protein